MTNERNTRVEKRFSFNRHGQRGGYVLVLVAMLLFGILGLAALVIDLGFARLAQRQMQSATDAAALEGLRFRDQLPPVPLSQDLEESRRLQASMVVAQLFDDTPEVVVGARGLSLNLDNSIEGDIVAGDSFDANADSSEDASYSRSDFIPDGTANDVLLVRIRRTGEALREGVGTAGPALPYMFGHGSLINRQLIDEGIKVRATSVASAEPVVSVGQPSPTVLGKLGIAISKDEWLNPPTLPSTPTFYEAPLGVAGEAIGPVAVSLPSEAGYIAVFSPAANNRVIGFGYASVTNGALTKLPAGRASNQIVYRNASATFAHSVQVPADELKAVFEERQLLRNQNQLLLAPVLVR